MDLIEQGEVLDELLQAMAAARRECGRVALIRGGAGSARSDLVSQLAEQFVGGCIVCCGSDDVTSRLPLTPLHDMLDQLVPERFATRHSTSTQTNLFAAFLTELRRSTVPVMLIFEDVDCAGPVIGALVDYLAQHIHRTRAFLVLTHSDPGFDVPRPRRAPGRENAATRLCVTVPSDRCAERLDEDGEAPFARVRDTNENLIDAGSHGLLQPPESPGGDPAPEQASRLQGAARDILDLISLSPGRLEVVLVDRVLGATRRDVARMLTSGLVYTDGVFYAFRAERSRLAVAAALTSLRCAGLHTALLRNLEVFADDDARYLPRLIRHAIGSGQTSQILRHVDNAASFARAKGRHREAADVLKKALVHCVDLVGPDHARRLEAHAHECYLTDQIERSVASYRAALGLWRQMGERECEGRCLRWLSQLHWLLGRWSDARAGADAAIKLLQRFPQGREHSLATCHRAALYLEAGDFTLAIEHAQHALELASANADAASMAHATTTIGAARCAMHDPAGRTLVESSLWISIEHGHLENAARCYVSLLNLALDARDYPEVERLLGESSIQFRLTDLARGPNDLLVLQARFDFEQGRWDTAVGIATRLAKPGAASVPTRVRALLVLARIRLRRGGAGASKLLSMARVLARDMDDLRSRSELVAAQAEMAWTFGERVSTVPALQECCELAARQRHGRILTEMSYWARRSGGFNKASNHVDPPYALQLQGKWREAASAWAAAGCLFEQALALMDGDDDSILRAFGLLDQLGATLTSTRYRRPRRPVPKLPTVSAANSFAKFDLDPRIHCQDKHGHRRSSNRQG